MHWMFDRYINEIYGIFDRLISEKYIRYLKDLLSMTSFGYLVGLSLTYTGYLIVF